MNFFFFFFFFIQTYRKITGKAGVTKLSFLMLHSILTYSVYKFVKEVYLMDNFLIFSIKTDVMGTH